jgi:hypothetical protein
MIERPATSEGSERRAPLSGTGRAIADLETASRTVLADRWRTLYRVEPPKGVGRRFLIGAIAHALQMKDAGQSTGSARRRLERLVEARSSAATTRIAVSRRLRPGARLIREWNGSTHTVEVVEDGYVWNGDRHRSLSAIARAITGTRWSGPRFFGLGQDTVR